MQMMVNDYPLMLSARVGAAIGVSSDEIEWVSPLASDEYAEYRDQGFLDRLGITLDNYPLREFWPARGPQWDALGRSGKRVILVEAKAHLTELVSSPTQAGPASIARIRASFGRVQEELGVPTDTDWTSTYYQYANRLAHLFLLCQLNRVPAELIHLCFLNDRDMDGPTSTAEWDKALRLLHVRLGISDHPLLLHVHHVFFDLEDVLAVEAASAK
jgi:hypothetical protein